MARRHEMSQVLEGVPRTMDAPLTQNQTRPNKSGYPKTKPEIQELTLRRHGAYQDSVPVPPCPNALRRQTTTRRRSHPDLHICLEDLVNYSAVSGHAGLRQHDIIQVLSMLRLLSL